jgi:hypothetical protein
MIKESSKPPATQRTFASVWAELDYLCKKTRYWLYDRREKPAAMRYLNRLARLLHDLPRNEVAILREECLALLSELKGNMSDAISHRTREIKLMERLHREALSPKCSASTRDYMLQDRDVSALRQRREILHALGQVKDGLSG